MSMPNGPDGMNYTKYGITGNESYGTTVADLPNRTRENIEEQLKADNLGDGNSVFTNPDGPFAQLAALLGAGKGPFVGLAQKLAHGLLDVDTDFPNLGAIITALTTGVAHPITEHTEAIATLNTIATAMDTTAAYVGDLQDMVTAQRSQLRSLAGSAARSVNIVTGFVIIGGGTLQEKCPVYYPDVTPLVSTGAIYYTPIVVDRVGDAGKIRWIVGADTSVFSIDYYEIALCAYDPPTGDIVKVWGSGDITSAEADSPTLTEVEIDMGLTGQHVTPGQILFVAHQQVAPGLLQAPRAFAAVPQGDIARPGSMLLDASCYVAPAYSQGIPSSISLASLDRENRFIPWAAVTVDS